MGKPHVLMLTPYLPYPPVSGGRMRTYNLLKFLSADYQITLVCFGRPEEQAFDITPLAEFCEYHVIDRQSSPSTAQAAFLSLTSIQPIMMRLYTNAPMRAKLAAILDSGTVDVVHVESFYMLQNLPEARTVPVLLSEPAIEYRAWSLFAKVAKPWYTRPGVILEALKLRNVEPKVWAQADAVGAMSAHDATVIREAAPTAQVTLAPNAVDVDYFTPGDAQRDFNTAVYMGDYKYFPNVDAVMYFAQQILPRIVAQRPDFRLVLLGKEPTPEIQALGGEHITVTGLVDDTRPYLQSSGMFVCPLRTGSGTRFKLLEALASGCPVISTNIGAEGLEAVDGTHMLLRDESQTFADAVIALMDDPARAQRIGQTGRAWVVENYAWQRSAQMISGTYQQLMAGGTV